jgi:hypothetical protein
MKKLQPTHLPRKIMAVLPFQYWLDYLRNYQLKESPNEDGDFWMSGSTYVFVYMNKTSLDTSVVSALERRNWA